MGLCFSCEDDQYHHQCHQKNNMTLYGPHPPYKQSVVYNPSVDQWVTNQMSYYPYLESNYIQQNVEYRPPPINPQIMHNVQPQYSNYTMFANKK